jgi:hypothetical protein
LLGVSGVSSRAKAIGRGRVGIAEDFTALTKSGTAGNEPDFRALRALAAATLIISFLAGMAYVAHATAMDAGLLRLLDVRRLWTDAAQPLSPCD